MHGPPSAGGAPYGAFSGRAGRNFTSCGQVGSVWCVTAWTFVAPLEGKVSSGVAAGGQCVEIRTWVEPRRVIAQTVHAVQEEIRFVWQPGRRWKDAIARYRARQGGRRGRDEARNRGSAYVPEDRDPIRSACSICTSSRLDEACSNSRGRFCGQGPRRGRLLGPTTRSRRLSWTRAPARPPVRARERCFCPCRRQSQQRIPRQRPRQKGISSLCVLRCWHTPDDVKKPGRMNPFPSLFCLTKLGCQAMVAAKFFR